MISRQRLEWFLASWNPPSQHEVRMMVKELLARRDGRQVEELPPPPSVHFDMYDSLPAPVRKLAYWLLLMQEPGQNMTFNPSAFGWLPDTLQAYVEQITRFGDRRYKVGRDKQGDMVSVTYRGDRDNQRAEKVAMLRERAGKMPAWKIAEEIGIATPALLYLAATEHISINYYRVLWDEHRESELLKLVAQGMSSTEIGKLYGVTGGAIEMQLVKMRKRGIPVPARMRGGYRGARQ